MSSVKPGTISKAHRVSQQRQGGGAGRCPAHTALASWVTPALAAARDPDSCMACSQLGCVCSLA